MASLSTITTGVIGKPSGALAFWSKPETWQPMIPELAPPKPWPARRRSRSMLYIAIEPVTCESLPALVARVLASQTETV